MTRLLPALALLAFACGVVGVFAAAGTRSRLAAGAMAYVGGVVLTGWGLGRHDDGD